MNREDKTLETQRNHEYLGLAHAKHNRHHPLARLSWKYRRVKLEDP